MKTVKLLFFSVMISLFFAGQAVAGVPVLQPEIFDIYDDDANTIENQIWDGVALDVWEDYNEGNPVPYPSHDGYALVSGQGQFFDKVVYMPFDALEEDFFILSFYITNTTDYAWSDYHFEFWRVEDEQYSVPYDGFPLVGWTSSPFPSWSFDEPYNVFSFYEGEHLPGDEEWYGLMVEWDKENWPKEFYFGIRQVATTSVPEPATMLLLGSGLIGLGVFRKRFRKK